MRGNPHATPDNERQEPAIRNSFLMQPLNVQWLADALPIGSPGTDLAPLLTGGPTSVRGGKESGKETG